MDQATLQEIFKASGAPWGKLNILGIRNCDDNPEKDYFNDTFIASNGSVILEHKGTTDPSIWWTLNPVTYKNVPGAAHLIEGYYENIWKLGIHAPGTKFAHEALIGAHGKIRFYRDVNRDRKYDEGDIVQEDYNDVIFINMHRAGLDDPTDIGLYGAGCMVRRFHQDHLDFMQMVKESGLRSFNFLLSNTKYLGSIV